MNMPLRPKPGRRLQYIRGQSRGFVLLERGYRRCGKLCSTSHLLVSGQLILRSSRGKEGTGQKGKQRGQIRLSGLTPDKFTNMEPLLGRAWRAIIARLKTSRRRSAAARVSSKENCRTMVSCARAV
ncbi:uncharacterized protein LOC119558479 [Drosophila subpulchrella]|uniref:uncharacterized protein LOC119558479 n=1 Tax=Drosophila subpulchrella TaxID=1486046 RepID=UPI0018A13351|nr:uncharacterized protein LOC119558479 [Drosophila subpulchrella]XP_037727924.1 uncharacterized protein LOC119558479 [Drosophila subpulchrella]